MPPSGRKLAPRDAAPSHSSLAGGLLLAALVLLLVARPLVPSEISAARGGGQLFVVLWIALAAGWLGCLAAGWLPRIAWCAVGDWLVLALFGVQCAVGLWHAGDGATRPALNLVGEHAALAIGYVLVRQLARPPAAARWLAGMMIMLAVVQAGLALFQYAVTMPATRAAYRADPEGALATAGVNAPPGSPQRELFEQRLDSREPLGRFELTNSLAGFLLAWLVVLVAGAVVVVPAAGSARWQSLVGLALVALLLGGCLLLTKSRSAVIGVTAVATIALLLLARRGARWRWSWVGAGLAGAALLIAIAAAVGGVDREVLTEAPKSLGYRWQYWQATAEMIAESPVSGVGLGNYGDRYTRYKAATASEEIADPHNALLEVAANSGAPAALVLIAALGCFFWTIARRSSTSDRPHETAPDVWQAWMALGALFAPVLALLAGELADVPLAIDDLLVIYTAAAIGFLLIWPWLRAGGDLALPAALGVVALLINLLAAGGIGFPSVAGSLWTLVALGYNAVLGDADRREPPPRSVAVGAGCLAVAALVALFVAFHPVVHCRTQLRQVLENPGALDEQRARLTAAAESDPLSPEPWGILAQIEWLSLEPGRVPAAELDPLRSALEAWLRRASPASSATWLQVGDFYMVAYQRGGSPADLRAALDCYARSVATYPNHALRHARYAMALAAAADPRAADEADRARALDDVMPHREQKLPRELLDALPPTRPVGGQN